MPQQTDGLMRGFQLWINLPAAEKMSDPEYQDAPAERLPAIEEAGQRIKLIAGEHAGRRGPVMDPHTQIRYLDVTLAQGRTFRHALPAAATAFAYVFEGEARCGETALPAHVLAVFGEGDEIAITARDPSTRFIFVAGRPIGEPIVQYGPFVMTSEADIRRAIDDYRHGRFAQRPPGTPRA
jgi:redox-sensitive bicupin YhaK (pirin superfamily)